MLPKETPQLAFAYSKAISQRLYTRTVTVKRALIDQRQSSRYCIRCSTP
jgi:hypothetical protein